MSAMSATALLAALLVGWACAVVDVAPPCPAEADRADGLVDASRQLLKARRDAEAAACLEKAYAASPSYLPALVESASAAARGGDHALAVQRYKLALKQEIAPATLNNLAIAHQAMDHHEEAVAAYRRALRFDEDDPSAYYNLGTALEKAGEYKLAVRAYKSAIDLEPEEAKYYSNMGGSLAAMNRTETAERSYKWAIKLSPKFADAYYNLGNLLLGTGKVELAIDRLEAALKLQPTHEKAIKKLADAKQELENKVAAFKVEVDQAIDKAQKMMNRGEI